ncbi:MAG: 50S ribosomal protein L13 [Alphaproteobacteria bacterium]|nr:MAG: 50S ribosomal protein L13 [Alphaproteobacteria bacterium]
MHTKSLKAKEIDKKWVLVDAENLVLGRMASVIAMRLKGKHKPSYTPHMDCGDNVVVINADKVHLTGKKMEDKVFYRHTGYPGGIKEENAKERLQGHHPETLVKKAVERMLSKGPLRNQLMRNLKVYTGADHPHVAQKPEVLNVAMMNEKNIRRDQ